jgi:HK97 family phage prohead protease
MDPELILKQLGIDLVADAEFLEPITRSIAFEFGARDPETGDGNVLKAFIEKDAETGEEEYVLSGIASSSIKDRHGDVMLPTALMDMERTANAGLTMFLNHSYDVPEDVAGSVRKASIKSTGTDDEGNPVYDLDYQFRINRVNKRAVEAFQSIQNKTKLGLSIGARIPEGGAIRNKKTGRLLIAHVDLLETSIVGVPANPRSWVEAAVKSYKAGPAATTVVATGIVETDDSIVLEDDPDTLKTSEGTGEPMVGVDVPEGATAELTVNDDGSSEVTITQSAPSQDAPQSTPGTDGLTASDDAGAASEPPAALADLEMRAPTELVQAVLTAQAALSETSMALIRSQEALREAEERALNAERERDRVVRGASDLAIDTAQIIQRIGSLPVGHRASFRRIQQDFNDGLETAKDIYGEDTIALLRSMTNKP